MAAFLFVPDAVMFGVQRGRVSGQIFDIVVDRVEQWARAWPSVPFTNELAAEPIQLDELCLNLLFRPRLLGALVHPVLRARPSRPRGCLPWSWQLHLSIML
ncbi:hypothetical protein [Bradyrhizobium sp. WSM3983]|uniref:hypothetical protein n=1 Tax=Bradyrhizobium sp. WSM3983 TaxID=1038867 RepID=UPI0012EB0DCA|nr:hypothetical protein [Bradyrhizobium sp. WSM3983]